MNGETVAGRRLLFTMATDHEHGVALRARIKPLITGVGPVEAAIATSLRLERMNAGAFAPTWWSALAPLARAAVGSARSIKSIASLGATWMHRPLAFHWA